MDGIFELTGFQRDLLVVISGMEKPSGQQVKEEIEQYIGEVKHGRLYPNLDTLVDRGFVEKGQIDRRTNYYQITESGRQALRSQLEWTENHMQITA